MNREQRIDVLVEAVGDLIEHAETICGMAVSDPMLAWHVLLSWQQAHRRLKVYRDEPRVVIMLDQLETAMDELAHALATVENRRSNKM